VVLTDQLSVIAEAFRLSWANIQLAVDGSKSPAFAARQRPGMALAITSAATGEGKSTHALAFARTAALAGEKVVLVDADLRRSGVSRLLDQRFCYTLRDFLHGQCTADEVVALEERSGVNVVPSSPVQATWTTQDIQRFSQLIDYLKQQFTVVIIDLPPILGLAETIRLSIVADTVVLIIRWARTERQFVQFALDALRSAGLAAGAAVLNDIDLKSQQRRGYRDRGVVYNDEGLYRAAPADREPASRPPLPAAVVAAAPEVDGQTRTPAAQGDRMARTADPERPSTDAASDIQRLYERYIGETNQRL
jgi:capsular exopolysaccharide synthesis family protein